METASTVFIVEDHPLTVSGLLQAFSEQTAIHVLGTANDSQTGLKSVNELRPAVTVLDLHLPGKLGPRQTIEAFCQLKFTKVLVLSAETRVAFVQEVLKSGAAGYLSKSEPPELIVKRVMAVIRGEIPQISPELLGDQLRLTKAQEHILTLVSKGWKYQQIADERNTSSEAVRHQCELLQLKAGVSNREELIVWALKNGYGD